MPANIASALSAYAKIAKPDSGGMAPRPGADPGSDFGSLLKDAVNTLSETGREAEVKTMEAVAGKADLTDVVTAVTNAEITLQTAVAIRDRGISAYQEHLRMPVSATHP